MAPTGFSDNPVRDLCRRSGAAGDPHPHRRPVVVPKILLLELVASRGMSVT
jgi:hypothetical protein